MIYMKLRKKLFLFSLLFISIWIIVMTILMDNTVIKGYETLEHLRFEWEVERALNGINGLIESKETIVNDWSKWDEAYRFVQNPTSIFIEENVTETLFQDLHLNHILFFDARDELIIAKGYSHKLENYTSVPKELIDDVLQFKNQSGLLYIDDRPLAFTAYQVTDSEGFENPLGLFVFAFYLDDLHLEYLSDSLKEDIRIASKAAPLNEVTTHYDIQTYSTYSIAECYMSYLNTPLALKFDVLLSHSITDLGKQMVKETLAMFILSFLLLSLLMYFGVRHAVLRILSISASVSEISHSHDLKKRLQIKGKDELGILGNDINLMLTKIENMNRQLTEYATFDMMTGVLNRRIGFEKLENLIEAANTNHFDLAISFIDINDLKYVNDEYGHNSGDQLIIDVSDILTANTRTTDILCRLGGDEFLIIFPYCDEKQAHETLDRIKKDIIHFNSSKNRQYSLSISNGIVEYDQLMSVDEFVEKADTLMYEDKKRIKEELLKLL